MTAASVTASKPQQKDAQKQEHESRHCHGHPQPPSPTPLKSTPKQEKSVKLRSQMDSDSSNDNLNESTVKPLLVHLEQLQPPSETSISVPETVEEQPGKNNAETPETLSTTKSLVSMPVPAESLLPPIQPMKGGSSAAPHKPRSATFSDTTPLPLPLDGGWGWLVVFASFVIHFLADGFGYAIGIFYHKFLVDFKSSRGHTGWVASIMYGTTYAIGKLTFDLR